MRQSLRERYVTTTQRMLSFRLQGQCYSPRNTIKQDKQRIWTTSLGITTPIPSNVSEPMMRQSLNNNDVVVPPTVKFRPCRCRNEGNCSFQTANLYLNHLWIANIINCNSTINLNNRPPAALIAVTRFSRNVLAFVAAGTVVFTVNTVFVFTLNAVIALQLLCYRCSKLTYVATIRATYTVGNLNSKSLHYLCPFACLYKNHNPIIYMLKNILPLVLGNVSTTLNFVNSTCLFALTLPSM